MADHGWTLGIVGHGADKFTRATERGAKEAMMAVVEWTGPGRICSGASPLGGVDGWAEKCAAFYELPFLEHAPQVNSWEATGGFRDRNLAIARDSEIVLCVVVDKLQPGYRGRRFDGCYHCARHEERPPEHVKSGGCWTAWKCQRGIWAIVAADGRFDLWDSAVDGVVAHLSPESKTPQNTQKEPDSGG